MLSSVIRCAIALTPAICTATAQTALAPTANTTIDVNPTQGVLSYSSITIPTGVTVQFTGNYPVRIDVSGDVSVVGELSVSALPSLASPPTTRSGPGAVTWGRGSSGSQLWIFGPAWHYAGSSPRPGSHSGVYGSTIPFDLAGGSPGGSLQYSGGPLAGYIPGGGAGGTLVLVAGGTMNIHGSISANGTNVNSASYGSGGSILLRALQGVSVASTGSVTANGGSGATSNGLIRIDTYDQSPTLVGLVSPTPTIVRFPDLIEVLPPVIGNSWQLRVMAPAGDTVFLSASFAPGTAITPYGTVGIELSTAIMFGTVTIPTAGHDRIGTFVLPVPNAPQFVGLSLFVQGLDWFTAQPPRYTQTLTTTVQ